MEENIKYLSNMEKYELINVNDGDKYGYLSNNDIIVDENGYLKLLILNDNNSKFGLFSKNVFIEVPWECIKKIGSRTIIIDADESEFRKTR